MFVYEKHKLPATTSHFDKISVFFDLLFYCRTLYSTRGKYLLCFYVSALSQRLSCALRLSIVTQVTSPLWITPAVTNLVSLVATTARTVRGGLCLLVFNFQSQCTIY